MLTKNKTTRCFNLLILVMTVFVVFLIAGCNQKGYLGEELLAASKDGDIEEIKRLIDSGADVNARDLDTWQTPLHWAPIWGQTDMAKILIDAGADVNARDDYERTPLYLAANNGHTDIVKLLIDAGADLNARCDDEWTPLHVADKNGHADIVKLLARHGADVI